MSAAPVASHDSRAALDRRPRTATVYEARRSSRIAYMSRRLRVLFTGTAFLFFFGVSMLLGTLFLPLLLVWMRRDPDHARLTRRLNFNMRAFSGFMRDMGLIAYWPITLPPELEGRPFLLIANHPTLIDVVLTMASLPQVSCVVKAEWYRSWIMGPMLRRTTYVPGPGMPGDEDGDDIAAIRRIEEALRSGVSVVVFPEGTRSTARQLRRFRRGAIEAAIRAGVPIAPLFIGVDMPILMKGQPWHDVPPATAVYRFEWLPIIETKGRRLDSRALTQELAVAYRERFERHLADRDAIHARLEAGERV
ncbi:MAG: lysophospholipid acyltransferase family protein [Sandaracinaceae bacterium]